MIRELEHFSWLYKVHIVNPLCINFFKYLEDYYEDSNNPNAVIQLEKSIQQVVKQYPEKAEFLQKIFASPEDILKKACFKELLLFCELYNIENKIKTPKWVKGETQTLTDDVINYLYDKLCNITFHLKFKKMGEKLNQF